MDEAIRRAQSPTFRWGLDHLCACMEHQAGHELALIQGLVSKKGTNLATMIAWSLSWQSLEVTQSLPS